MQAVFYNLFIYNVYPPAPPPQKKKHTNKQKTMLQLIQNQMRGKCLCFFSAMVNCYPVIWKILGYCSLPNGGVPPNITGYVTISKG